jgi:hypothetical protein
VYHVTAHVAFHHQQVFEPSPRTMEMPPPLAADGIVHVSRHFLVKCHVTAHVAFHHQQVFEPSPRTMEMPPPLAADGIVHVSRHFLVKCHVTAHVAFHHQQVFEPSPRTMEMPAPLSSGRHCPRFLPYARSACLTLLCLRRRPCLGADLGLFLLRHR